MPPQLEQKQKIQEEQYEYPYHYIPTAEAGKFSQVRYWSWGYRYLGGQKLILDQLEKESFNSLIDIGCGDGRFISEVAKRYPHTRLLGIDYSKRAIQLAKAMNPELKYKTIDITRSSIADRFDVATLIEVLEHLSTDQVPSFLKAASALINDKGCLVLTVPHTNTPLSDKHYQHYERKQLYDLLNKHFREITIIPFDPKSKVMGLWRRLMGSKGQHFILTNRWLNCWFWQMYTSRYLYANDERKCTRIAAVCKK